MRFATYPLEDALGVVLAHGVGVGVARRKKGYRLEGDDLALLRANGIGSVAGVKLDDEDVGEDDAATRLAAVMVASGIVLSSAVTGRLNIHAGSDGLFVVDRATVDGLNGIDPSITFACLANRVPVRAGDIVATIKIIPFAVRRAVLDAAVQHLQGRQAVSVKPFCPHSVILIATQLPGLKTSTMDRTAALLAQRLTKFGSRIIKEERIPHDPETLTHVFQRLVAQKGNEPAIYIVFGAAAVADSGDVIPAAIRAAGGHVERVGMPVDPGNLLVLGQIGNIPVIGAPGCARSPKRNGFDWILGCLTAGERPTSQDIAELGVGGLLAEIADRPSPRDGKQKNGDLPVVVAGLLMAAGAASRMGSAGQHKLLAEFDGVPLVRRSAETLIASAVNSVTIVTGHRHEDMEEVLSGLNVRRCFNPHFQNGMASSLISGLSTPDVITADGVLIMLADMPGILPEHLCMMISAFHQADGLCVVRATGDGKRGNPVILPRSLYGDILELKGDVGARSIIEQCGLPVIDVEIGTSAHLDVDTPEAVVSAGGILRG